MIQDLDNRHLNNQYQNIKAQPCDRVFCFDGDKTLICGDKEKELCLPKAEDFGNLSLQYLFCIEDERYFLAMEKPENVSEEFYWESIRNLRNAETKEVAFASATAYHLSVWYKNNRFCGHCGHEMKHSEKERMLRCPHCGNMVFPKIAPAVIIGVINGDKLLLTKYNGRAFKKYALIAGFTEIGETAEETVKREVMEEAGVKVKNITYYKSQPWGVDSNLLLGFFCEVDGDDTITMDEDELSVAEWVDRADVPEDDGFSLTRAMMGAFRKGEK